MKKPDDCSLSPEQYLRVRAEAQSILRKADAVGRLPTPIADLMTVANVTEVPDDVLSLGFIDRLRRKAGGALKRALSKVLGIFDAAAGLIYIDRSLMQVKQNFIRLHETGHGFMPWQRKAYAVVEECEKSLDVEIADSFDREANVFAAEVLFQIDGFSNEARDYDFGIRVPLNLAKRYGASVYSSVRQYVSKSQVPCTVLVINQPEFAKGDGFNAHLRRAISSASFELEFGHIAWPIAFTPDDQVGAMLPIHRRMSGKRKLQITDRNGTGRQCTAEAFNSQHQIFVLIRADKK